MTLILAVGAGAGMGLAYFGGLWLTVSRVVSRPSLAFLVPLASGIRLLLLGVGLIMLSRHGSGGILSALAGLWLARWFLVRQLGGTARGK
jgi:F1F0 ATPase subunit 2